MSPYTSPLVLGFVGFRLAVVVAGLGACLWLWRRPRPALAVTLILAANVTAALAYMAPLERSYALEQNTDRAFNLGMALATAHGGSPFQHTQIGFASPEPFWNVAIAALALFEPRNVPLAFHLLAPLSILAVGLGLYRGMRADGSALDGWECALMVFAVFGLASLTSHPKPPVPPLWTASFLLKPNHAVAWGLVGVIVGLRARSPQRFVALGLSLGVLAWVFLVDWAYMVLGLALGWLLAPRAERHTMRLSWAVGVAALMAAPFIVHLALDYNPAGAGKAARHMWADEEMGPALAVPTWSTLDLGLLLILGALGLVLLMRRRTPRDRGIAGLLLGAIGLWSVSLALAPAGFAPEPDDLHYFLRFVLALAAGTALAALGRHLESHWRLQVGQGHVLALAACWPLSFIAYWDPPNMDRYFPLCREPVKPKIEAYARWVRENTSPRAVFVGGEVTASWIPALTGRRVLLAPGGALWPRDHEQREAVVRALLTGTDPASVRAAAARYGVTHIALDDTLLPEYGAKTFYDLARSPALETLYADSAVRIVGFRPPGRAER